MYLGNAVADFEYLNSLPGKKLLLKGNHDYWWSTAAKFNKFCQENGIVFDVEKCFEYMHQFEEKETFEQMTLF